MARQSPRLVFLPGFMQHADAWEPVAEAVGERYPSVLVDFETWTFGERMAEIAAVASVRDVLVGYSMGGRLALHAALRAPYAGLVVVGASAGIDDEVEHSARRDADVDLAEWIEGHDIEEIVDRWERNPVFESQSAEIVAAQRAGRLRHSPADLARLLRSAGQGALPSLWEALPDLDVPLLAIAGDYDDRYVHAAERIASTAPRGAAVLIEDAGHAAHLEQPQAVADAIVAFFQSS